MSPSPRSKIRKFRGGETGATAVRDRRYSAAFEFSDRLLTHKCALPSNAARIRAAHGWALSNADLAEFPVRRTQAVEQQEMIVGAGDESRPAIQRLLGRGG
jgi:hypothetical protein